MAEMMDIIKGISQVMANTYDGAVDKDGKVRRNTIRFPETNDSYEMRGMIEGFRARVSGDKLIINFQTDVTQQEAHDPKFEQNTKKSIAEAVKYLKKEFKKVTGKTLSLDEVGDMKMTVEMLSRLRTTVTACCIYKIGGADKQEKEKKVDTAIKNWLKLGKNKGPKGVGDKLPEDLNAADGD